MWSRSICHLESLLRHSSNESKVFSLLFANLLRSPWFTCSLYFCSEVPHAKTKSAPLQETRMRDKFKLFVKGGDGGNGCSSFRRSRHDSRGRPDGGNGGRGGDVILECSPAVWDFSGLQPHIKAGKGGNGHSKNMIGTRGEDKVVQVPIGTVIHAEKGELPTAVVESCSTTDLDPWDLPGTLDTSQNETLQDSFGLNESVGGKIKWVDGACNTSLSNESTLCKQQATPNSEDVEFMQCNVVELTKPGQHVLVANGGEGGLGNVSCQNINKANVGKLGSVTVDNESSLSLGSLGSETVVTLELKSIADVGLVGMPNAGKSTLLGAISRAKPRVGHYAFTTLRPNLGKLNFDDFSITVADIPGLIKGAHENRGLGHAFLRHIERTKVLAYVLDLALKGLSPWQQLKDLVLELEHHQEGLSNRPSLIVANKIDELGAEEVFEELKRRVDGVPIYPVCAVLEEGVPELKAGLRMLVDDANSRRLCLDKIDCS